jgi:hypothetical protein
MKRERFLTPRGGHVYMTAAGAVDMADPITAAERGDRTALAARIRDASASADERTWAADYLEGRIKNPAHRPASVEAAARRYDLAVFVHLYERMHHGQRKAAVSVAAGFYEVSEKHVFDALREVADNPAKSASLRAHADFYVAICERIGGLPTFDSLEPLDIG